MKEADVGNIGINVPVPQPFAFFPLGSKNESALGVAKSRIDSIEAVSESKDGYGKMGLIRLRRIYIENRKMNIEDLRKSLRSMIQ